MKIAGVRKKQLQKEAPGFDEICTDFHLIRNKTRGGRAVLSDDLASYGKMDTSCQVSAKI